MNWFEDHKENFIQPYLSKIPEKDYGRITPEMMTIVKNAWRSVKKAAREKKIILPGRDAFIFEILAQRERYPTIFIPECGRQTVHFWKGEFDPNTHIVFDTGFAGTISCTLGLPGILVSRYRISSRTEQVFPRLTQSRSLALTIEATPKYWTSSTPSWHTDKPIQFLSPTEEFEKAAALTLAIYTDSSPRFIKGHKPLNNIRRTNEIF